MKETCMSLERVGRSMIAEEMLLDEIEKVMKESGKDKILIAIDGRCASGKTTLAGKLAKNVWLLCKWIMSM